jgi:hypothetical protein
LSIRKGEFMQGVTEEMGTYKEWYVEAKDQTLETLPEFLRKLTQDYNHDYGTVRHALTAGAIGTLWAMNKYAGISGFQAGAIMWEFIRNWQFGGRNNPLRLMDFGEMLYPQYEPYFDKTMSQEAFTWLQTEAKTRLAEGTHMHPSVKAHMESIAFGKIPFGYRIEDSNTTSKLS